MLAVELPSHDGLPLMWGGRREPEGVGGGYVWSFLEGSRSNELIGGRVIRSCALVIVREGEGGGGEGGEGLCRAVAGEGGD